MAGKFKFVPGGILFRTRTRTVTVPWAFARSVPRLKIKVLPKTLGLLGFENMYSTSRGRFICRDKFVIDPVPIF